MISRMTRYLLWELIRVFLFALIAFSVVLVAVVVINEAIRSGIPPHVILDLIPFAIVQTSQITIPLALLLAVTTVYSEFSGSNEFTALKALGISPVMVIWPTLFLAVLLSFFAVWVNDIAVSRGRVGIQRVIFNAGEEILYEMLRVNQKYDTNDFSISVHDIHGKILEQVTIIFNMDGRKATLHAQEATITRKEEEQIDGSTRIFFVISAKNVTIQGDGFSGQYQGEYQHKYPLPPISIRPSDTSLSQIPSEIQQRRFAILQLEESIAASRALRLLAGDFRDAGNPSLEQQREQQLVDTKRDLRKLCTEPWRRWACGFCCLSFVWMGIPLSLSPRIRASDFWVSFFVCFAPILLLYFPLFMLGLNLSKEGIFPPCGVWLGNGVMFIMGLLLFRPVMKH